ncbi:MAG: glutamate formimidoyltransferase [Bacteroidia bacterium]|nr:glutamate formimidoyltransferase [Bacteroidia bacterium]
MTPLLECVPNFSEGQDEWVIEQIAEAIRAVEDVLLLDVDPGYSANRTVMTFVGEPAAVCEAAFQAIKLAAELIDMSKQSGVHPRMGATDVCPLIPIRGIDWEEANGYANDLAKRVGEELRIPVYLYEKSAKIPGRKNLAHIRKGGYEAFKTNIYKEEWKPDYGPIEFNEGAGQTVIGARDFLIAYNINLNTDDSTKAEKIARLIRESGYLKKENGKTQIDPWGNPLRVKGKFKGLKAIGWYMDEYSLAQVSMNITDRHAAPIHEVFEEVDALARKFGMRVTGSELIGLIPKKVLLEAGYYYLKLQGDSPGIAEKEVLDMAISSLGLDALEHFETESRILEHAIKAAEGENSGLDIPIRKWLESFENEHSNAEFQISTKLWTFLSRISRAIGFINGLYGKTNLEGDLEQWSQTAIELQIIKEELLNALELTYPYLQNKESDISENQDLYALLFDSCEACWNIVQSWHDEDVLRGETVEDDYFKNVGWPLMDLLQACQAIFSEKDFVQKEKTNKILENIKSVTIYQNI